MVHPDYLGWLAKALWLWQCVPNLGWGLVQLAAEILAGQIGTQEVYAEVYSEVLGDVGCGIHLTFSYFFHTSRSS